MFVVNVKNKVKYSLVCTNCVMIIHHASGCFIVKFENLLVWFADGVVVKDIATAPDYQAGQAGRCRQ